MVRVVLGLLEQGGHVVVVQVVLDLVAAAPDCPDQPAVTEQAELVRYGGLAGSDGERDVAHADRTPHKGIQDLCPGGVAEGIERFDHQPQDLWFGKSQARVGNSFKVDGQVSRVRCHSESIPVYLFRYSSATDNPTGHWGKLHHVRLCVLLSRAIQGIEGEDS